MTRLVEAPTRHSQSFHTFTSNALPNVRAATFTPQSLEWLQYTSVRTSALPEPDKPRNAESTAASIEASLDGLKKTRHSHPIAQRGARCGKSGWCVDWVYLYPLL